MKVTSSVYQNKKGAVTVLVRLPMEIALRVGVADSEAEGMVRQSIEQALNDRRGEGAADEA